MGPVGPRTSREASSQQPQGRPGPQCHNHKEVNSANNMGELRGE